MEQTGNITKLLVQTVGTGGDKNPVWEGLAFSVRARRPDLLVQWCSNETLQKTVPRFEQSLGRVDWPLQVRRAVCRDERDLDALTLEYARALDALRAEFPCAVLEVDFTSGTKAMSAAAVAAAVSRRVPRLHYAVGPNDATGRAVATERLVTTDTSRLVAERQLVELAQLFNLGQFAAVRVQAATLAADLDEPLLKARADSIAFLAEAYELWDHIDWRRACAKLELYNSRRWQPCLEAAGWNLDHLAAQLAHLEQCKERHGTPQRLADLLANAERCIDRARYDDAVARLYRLTEYILQVRFAAVLSDFPGRDPANPTKRVPLEALARIAPGAVAAMQPRLADAPQRVDLGLYNLMAVLAETDDKLAQQMLASYGKPQPSERGPLGKRLESRNNSLLGHGTEPVPQNVATELRDLLTGFLEQHVGSQGHELRALMHAAHFHPCPWSQPGTVGPAP